MYAIEEDLFFAMNSFVWNNTYIIIHCNEDVFHLAVCPAICPLDATSGSQTVHHGVARSGSSNSLNSRLFERNLDP
jgi:hypothetical protein